MIGAVETNLAFLAKRIAKYYRVLLFDKDEIQLSSVYNQLLANDPFANLEKMKCFIDASWEADIIIISGNCCIDDLIIEKIKHVSTGKIVIVIYDKLNTQEPLIDYFDLKQILKHVKLVQVYFTINSENEVNKNLIINGNDKAALEMVSFLFTLAGFAIDPTLNTISLP